MIVTPFPTVIRRIPILEQDWTPPETQTRPKRLKKPRTKKVKLPNPAGYRKRLNCVAGHPLTPENLYITGNKRRCRTCQKSRVQEHRERKRNLH